MGSDVDLIVVVERAEGPFERRAVHWYVTGLPVPAEVLVYTRAEGVGEAQLAMVTICLSA